MKASWDAVVTTALRQGQTGELSEMFAGATKGPPSPGSPLSGVAPKLLWGRERGGGTGGLPCVLVELLHCHLHALLLCRSRERPCSCLVRLKTTGRDYKQKLLGSGSLSVSTDW